MIWPDMALRALHNVINRTKHYLFGQAKPGLPHFADGYNRSFKATTIT